MAPGGKKGPQERLEARNTLQALLLADSFTQRFRPITVERPKVLLPLVNVPMIEYTLEWLALNKVEEVFVFCCAHADQIKKYLSESKWANNREMTVTTIISTSCLSAGEAFRLVDQRDVIKGDFILVSGDTVSNMSLAPVLEAHKARRAADKNALMTMVMKPIQHPLQRLRLGDSETVVCLDSTTNRLLKFLELESGKAVGSVKVDAAFFSERDCVQVRTDLMDTNIAICAPEVLMLFSDNFDYQNLKRDFVSGVLSEEELGNKLYVHELTTEYAAHIHNLRSYDAISRDIMQRWCFPFAPDTNVLFKGGPWGPATYRYGRGHRYFESHVTVQRSAVVGEDVCVGAGSAIGDNSKVVQSVIGRNVRIGKNVNIQGCYIQDNVTIQDNAVLRHAMVCEHAVLQAGCTVQAGAIISYGAVIAPRHQVEPYARISLCQQIHQSASLSDDELEYAAGSSLAAGKASVGGASSGRMRRPSLGDSDSDDDTLAHSLEKPSDLALKAAEALAMGQSVSAASLEAPFDESAVGYGGAGYRWTPSDAMDVQRYSIAPPSSIESVVGADAELDAPESSAAAGARGGKAGSSDSEEEDEEEILDPEANFKREVSETFLRCVKLRFDQTNAVIELNGLKIAEDRTFADCARYIFTTMLGLCLPAPTWAKEEYADLFPKEAPNMATQDGKLSLLKTFKKRLTDWGPLLQRFLRSEDDQVELLLTFEEYCSHEGVFEDDGEKGQAFDGIFVQVLQQLYDTDIIGEEAFIAWADEKEHADEEERKYLRKADKFIEWLRTADDDDSDEESDEEED